MCLCAPCLHMCSCFVLGWVFFGLFFRNIAEVISLPSTNCFNLFPSLYPQLQKALLLHFVIIASINSTLKYQRTYHAYCNFSTFPQRGCSAYGKLVPITVSFKNGRMQHMSRLLLADFSTTDRVSFQHCVRACV